MAHWVERFVADAWAQAGSETEAGIGSETGGGRTTCRDRGRGIAYQSGGGKIGDRGVGVKSKKKVRFTHVAQISFGTQSCNRKKQVWVYMLGYTHSNVLFYRVYICKDHIRFAN